MKRIIILSTMIILSLPAIASNYNLNNKEIITNGFFIGAKIGAQKSYNITSFYDDSISVNYGIYGGIQLNKNWSWDLGYQGFNKQDIESIALIESAFKYEYLIKNSDFGVYGRFGAAHWNLNKTSSALSPLFEIGTSYLLTPRITANLGYEFIPNIGIGKIGKFNSHSVMIGISYKFGSFSNHNSDTFNSINLRTEVNRIQKEEENKRIEKEKALKVSNQLNEDLNIFKSKKIMTRFKLGSSSILKEDIESLLKELKDIKISLDKYPKSEVYLIGHTDKNGKSSYNLWISEKRAKTIADKLETLGVKKTRIHVKGMGEVGAHGNINANDRRVDIVLTCDNYCKN
ncbi:OmpA family protein [Aliivibrio fischeri]|uniref:OmpA family protein n=1 Tax=Aliivibrio fischeri TaxID=668 RepID=UPI0009BEA2F6|nr:OmpA family protein [Aliivibrio fischeri]